MSCNNTNSTCTSCNHNYSSCNNKCAKCGCKDSFLTSPPPCPTPQGCPDPIPCQEVLSSDCIIYNGPNILCNNDIVVYSDATWTEILEDIVAYFCVPSIPEITCNGDIVVTEDSTINEALEDIVSYFCLPLIPEILCGEDIVVTEESSINVALEDIVDYFCNALTNISSTVVTGGTNISVTSATVGNVTTYTVRNTCKCILKYVEDFTSVFDGDTHVIPGTALINCGFFTLANQGCSRFATITYFCDFNFSLYYLVGGVWKSIPEKPFGTAGPEGYVLEVNNTTGDITITLAIAPIDVVPVRVVIIG